MNREELQDQIQWEAEQYIPFDVNEVNLDFQILDANEEEGQMDVLLVAILALLSPGGVVHLGSLLLDALGSVRGHVHGLPLGPVLVALRKRQRGDVGDLVALLAATDRYRAPLTTCERQEAPKPSFCQWHMPKPLLALGWTPSIVQVAEGEF